MLPIRVLARKRAGDRLTEAEIQAVVAGATDGSWSDAQLAAFLMATAIHGLDVEETSLLTGAMLESGEQWRLGREIPTVCDKHSTGGVGDKTSLILAPLLAACDLPVVMLTGRGLGHTGGTADKLESIPGLTLDFDRERCLELLRTIGVAIGIATTRVAPADRRLYAIRDQTATVESLPLITASILSKKLATGASALVLDVKTGSGAFLTDPEEAERLARLMVASANPLGCRTSALITDMSQPLGEWVGHTAEVAESLACLGGEGPSDLVELTCLLASQVAGLQGVELSVANLQEVLASGRAREKFLEWCRAQGAEAGWTHDPRFELAPVEVPIVAPRAGYLAAVDNRQLGLLLIEAGGGRRAAGAAIDFGVSMRYSTRLGRALETGEELARLYLRQADEALTQRFLRCFSIADSPVPAPPLVRKAIPPTP